MKTGKKEFSSLFFIQMSDPQLGMYTANRDFQQETELFERAISYANQLRPQFVLLSGDLINEPCDETQAQEALRILGQLDEGIALHLVAGNHDVGDHPDERALAWYRDRFGPDWYSFDQSGCHFTVLNSNLIAGGENAGDQVEKQWQWLEKDLTAAAKKQYTGLFMCMHHPLFLESVQEEDDYFNIPKRMRNKYVELFVKYGVRSIFAGHLHQNRLACDGAMEMITTGPVGMPLGGASSGFRLVEVQSGILKHQFYTLEVVPELFKGV